MESEPTLREINRLRRCTKDLLSLLTLPAMWTGHDSSLVTTTLLNVVVEMLDLDFAYVRTKDVGERSQKEWIRSAHGGRETWAEEIGRALGPYLTDDSTQPSLRIVNPVGEGTASITVFQLGIQDSVGVFVAGSRRLEFPTETERLLLHVAASQATITLQEARIAQRDANAETERAHARAALQEVEERFRTMADSIPEVIWITALEPERVLYTSPSFERIWGLSVDDLYRNPRLWTETIHPEDRDRISNTFSLWISGAEINYHDVEYRIVRPDGDIRWIHEHGVLARDHNGKPVGVSGISTDITDRKHTEESLRHAQARLSRAAQVATEGELAGAIAHEINQPLAGVVANAHAGIRWLSAESPNLARAREAMERIVQDGNDAAEVVQRTRALFAGAKPKMMPLHVNELIGEILRFAQVEASRKGITIESSLEQGLPPVLGDRLQVQQVLLNLMVNGIEATDCVTDRPKRLFIRTEMHSPDAVRLEIRDNGVGLQDPDKAFEPFFTTKEAGMGMGLAICRTIVEAHEGQLWAKANDDFGTTFCFTLPLGSASMQRESSARRNTSAGQNEH